MKKFLAILLIAVIACADIEEDNLKGEINQWKLIKMIRDFAEFLNQNNLKKEFLEELNKGKESAVQFCYIHYKKSDCPDIIALVVNAKKYFDKY